MEVEKKSLKRWTNIGRSTITVSRYLLQFNLIPNKDGNTITPRQHFPLNFIISTICQNIIHWELRSRNIYEPKTIYCEEYFTQLREISHRLSCGGQWTHNQAWHFCFYCAMKDSLVTVFCYCRVELQKIQI